TSPDLESCADRLHRSGRPTKLALAPVPRLEEPAMRRTAVILALVCATSCLFATDGGAATIVHAGRLIDGRSDKPRTEASIVIDDGKISKIVDGYLKPGENDKVISLVEHTVMPGLMDMHTHLQSQHSKDSYTERFFMEQAD